MRSICARILAVAGLSLALAGAGVAQQGAASATATAKKPNILVIMGDDIGMWNVGAYTHGMMGRTPAIDSIARQGVIFTDHYGQPSCTAGQVFHVKHPGALSTPIPNCPRNNHARRAAHWTAPRTRCDAHLCERWEPLRAAASRRALAGVRACVRMRARRRWPMRADGRRCALMAARCVEMLDAR